MRNNPVISIVIPIFNEEENLKELIDRCLNVCRNLKKPFEVILVDDGSNDDGPKIITEAVENNSNEIIGVFLNRNYGQHAAIMAGFTQLNGEICITLDADLQNPPDGVTTFVRRASDLQDPWGKNYTYQYPGTRNSGSFDLSTTAPDGTLISNW